MSEEDKKIDLCCKCAYLSSIQELIPHWGIEYNDWREHKGDTIRGKVITQCELFRDKGITQMSNK